MKLTFSLVILSCCSLCAQMPDTEIWLFTLEQSKEGTYTPVKPVNVSNRKGYDNQPYFSGDSKTIYYSSDQNKQADIYTYRKQKSMRLTSSEESEYSPRPVPGSTLLAAVAVEQDSAQRLHFISAADGRFVRKLDTDSMGYYCFLNADTIVFYKLTDPHSLRWITQGDSTEHFLAQHPARGFAALNRNQLLFGTRDSVATTFYIYDFALGKARPYAKKSPPAEDLYWHPGLGLMVCEGTAIQRYRAESGQWEKFLDLGGFGLSRISRFAIDNKTRQLVVVDNPE